MTEEKKTEIKVITLEELEKDLESKKTVKVEMERIFQQVLGQISCLKTLIEKVKGEDKKEENKNKEVKN